MRKFTLLAGALLCLVSMTTHAQLLSGKVINEDGDRLTGISVILKNSTTGVTTDFQGMFRITLRHLPDTLVFSGVDFESYQLVVTEKNIRDTEFEVVLLRSRAVMSEVVVTAYGIKKARKETSYSTSRVSAKELSYAPSSTSGYTASALEGKVSGVEVSSSGSSIMLRGASTITGTGTTAVKDKPVDADTPATGVAASRLLTAGEVNDFRKWKMWEDYTSNEFKEWSLLWGITPTQRYSVQLTDKNFNAVVGEPLFLVNRATSDTVWRTVTDNTGKAELWAGFFTKSAKTEELFITDRFNHQLSKPTGFEQGMNLLVVDKSCNVSNNVDIAFVVDATGSMRDEIDFLKLELEDVLRNAMAKYKTLDLKAAPVFYRDSTDAYLTQHSGFNDDLLKTINFIKRQQAAGGGDYPEAVDDALGVALDSLYWRTDARTKLLFLVLDAPPHATAMARIHQQILRAAAMGIHIIPIACSGTDKSTEFLLRSMALATNGTYTFLTDHSGVGNKHIEPTTDKYDVELLSALLERLLGQFLYAKDCSTDPAEQVVPDNNQPGNLLSVKVYPNPTSGKFVIESSADIKDMFVADFTGKILQRLTGTDKKGKWMVDIGAYPSATYLVKYITKENKWGSEKVILIH